MVEALESEQRCAFVLITLSEERRQFTGARRQFTGARRLFTGKSRIVAGERRHFSFSQRPGKTLAAAAANISSGRGNRLQRPLRT